MPRILKDENQRKISCNISLPVEFIRVIDDYVETLKNALPLPKNFSRSDLVRIMVNNYLYTPYRLRSGKRVDLSNGDEMRLTLDVAKEYGLVEFDQLSLDFDTELENSINSKERK